jgi:hypothetical protein
MHLIPVRNPTCSAGSLGRVGVGNLAEGVVMVSNGLGTTR